MSSWSFHFARGWNDRPFHDLKNVPYLDREGDLRAAFCIHAYNEFGNTQGGTDYRVYESSLGTDVLAGVFGVLARVPEYLDDDLATGVHVMFANTKARVNEHAPRPEPLTAKATGYVTAIQMFFEAVTGSLALSGGLSLCEWAVIAATRNVGGSDRS